MSKFSTRWWKTNTAGTDSLFVMTHKEIRNIPKDRTVTYVRMVVDYRTQKPYTNRVRITAEGNLIKYPGELTTQTADLTTSKIIWKSVLSTKDAKYMCIDIKNFYLGNPLDSVYGSRPTFVRMSLSDPLEYSGSLCVSSRTVSLSLLCLFFHHLVLNFPILSPMLLSRFLWLLDISLRFWYFEIVSPETGWTTGAQKCSSSIAVLILSSSCRMDWGRKCSGILPHHVTLV